MGHLLKYYWVQNYTLKLIENVIFEHKNDYNLLLKLGTGTTSTYRYATSPILNAFEMTLSKTNGFKATELLGLHVSIILFAHKSISSTYKALMAILTYYSNAQ